MGDENPICTLVDYSRPSHDGYRNTIELLEGNNMVPLQSDTIRLVQNRCSFHGLWSEDPNQHLKDFFKLVDSLDLDGENRERTRMCLFQFSLRDQASNWLERLPAGSISTWEDLTTRFLAQFFLPGRTTKLCNDILIARLTTLLAENYAIRTPTNLGKLLRTLPSTTMKASQGTHDQQNPEKVLIREEAKFPVTKNLNSISLTKGDKRESDGTKSTSDYIKEPTKIETEMPVVETKEVNEVKSETNASRASKSEEAIEAPGAWARKKKGKEYKILPGGAAFEAILKKRIARKEDIRGNF
ncbi:zinc finger, CCHC-type containing protein [Tanacetum coccineum]